MESSGKYGYITAGQYEPKRPSQQNFDSLQDLLEQAGYKETRIFTPASVHNSKAHSTPPREALVHVRGNMNADVEIDSKIASTSSSNWFSNLWRNRDASKTGVSSERKSRQKVINRKQSEPVLSKNGRKAIQQSWMGMWVSTGPIEAGEDSAELSSTEMTDSTPNDNQTDFESDSSQVNVVKSHKPSLRHATSTGELWRGSLHHHRSFPTKIIQKESELRRMESFDGAAVVAGVGVAPARSVSTELIFKNKQKHRKSLRQAFADLAKDEVQQKKVQEIKLQSKNMSATKADELVWADSVGTLTDLDDKDKITNISSYDTTESSTLLSKTPNALFSIAAAPLLSRQEAVAMRNVDCLDFAGLNHGGELGEQPKRRSLHKMRSVDALELALAKMQKKQEAYRTISTTRHDMIPESFSAESLTNEDLASGATVTTVVDGLDIHQEGLKEDVVDAIQRSSTPRLMLTSPTGLRSPQELHLEGREYEPRSYSPQAISLDRIVADMTSWKVNASIVRPEAQRGRDTAGNTASPDLSQFATIPKRSSSRRRSRTIRTREISQDNGDLSVPSSGKQAKKRNSKSCHDLRQASNAVTKNQTSDVIQMSGSEQVRALKREVMERNKIVSKRRSAGTIAAIPCSPIEGDDNDPFSDVDAIAKVASATSQSRVSTDQSKTSSVPFEPIKSRRPLSISHVQVQAQIQAPTSPTSMHADNRVLTKKKSGVGIACLVEKETQKRPISINDENEPLDSLLESPTAQIVKKRISRTILR